MSLNLQQAIGRDEIQSEDISLRYNLRGFCTIRGDLLTNVTEAMGWEPLGLDPLALRDILPRQMS